MPQPPLQPLDVLHKHFGYNAFRVGQEQLIGAILQGRDVLGVMPTGAGKSVCYQIPALLLHGITIVISPLISLMRDQVDNANEIGIPAAFINTTQTQEEQTHVFNQCLNGSIKLLYVAPERLETQRFQTFASHVDIALVAVDEAHCVSQWGQDFRSSYLGIGEFLHALPDRPTVAAFTATATERVRRDIITLLDLHNPTVVVTGFDRTNLFFDIHKFDNRDKQTWIQAYVRDHRNESGIIYCATRKQTETIAALLGAHAVAYHGGMSAQERERAQRDFVTDRVNVVVATNAFGMGIDKSNVRYVIHYNMPESIEAYYQEAGRAGRDGEPSRCTLLWNESDIVTRRRLLDNNVDNERLSADEQETVRQSKRHLLDGMISYCRTTDCLHAYITRYFGQSLDSDECTGGCVNCHSTFETIDVTNVARSISICVHDLEQHYGTGKIVQVLRGSKARDVLERNLNMLPSYGVLSQVSEARIRDVLNQMVADNFLCIGEGRMPLVQFGPRAAVTAQPNFHYEIKRTQRKPSTSVHSFASQGTISAPVSSPSHGDTADSDALFERLRALRLEIAREIGKPPYIVFSDRSLHDMAQRRPHTPEEFLEVNGVGANKLQRYGKRFLALISNYRD